MGDISIGNTKSLIGLYTIVAVLRKLADWIEGPFQDWIASVFL